MLVEGLAAAGGAIGGAAGFPWRKPVAIRLAATNTVAASAPHFVLRRQNNAATITGDIAAKPEKA